MGIRKSAFETALAKVERKSRQLVQELQAVRSQAASGNIVRAYDMALHAEDTSERLTLLMRSLPVYTGNPMAGTDAAEVTKVNIPLEIGYTNRGWFVLRMPMLLPKKEAGSADYIRSFLYPAMKEFFGKSYPVKFTDCVLVYRHVYDTHRPERAYRDHDNIELNMVTDIVALYVMEDDAPLRCRHYYCSAAGMTERTEVYVVPREEFSEFLSMEDQIPEKGVRLYEIRSILEEKDVPDPS